MKFKFLLSIIISFLVLGAFVILTPEANPPVSLPEDAFINITRQKTAQYHKRNAFERIYLHTDRALYQPGEVIWFSGYLQALGQKREPLSNVVHVAIKDPKGNVIKSLVYPLMNGKIRGDFRIDPNKPGGMYEIVAYTHWMKNFGEKYYFRKKLQVQKIIKPRLLLKLDFKRKGYGPNDWVEATLKARDTKDNPIAGNNIEFKVNLSGKSFKTDATNTNGKGEALIRFQLPAQLKDNDGLLNVMVNHKGVTESISRSIPLVLNKITLDFYPEGGNWVAGVDGKMAFKALNEFFKPADIEGVVIDSKGQTIANFKSFHDGMGAFSMTPKTKEKYQVKITKPEGIAKLYALPIAEKNTIALAVTQVNAQQLKVKLYTPKTDTFYLAAQSGGKIHEMQKILVSAGVSYKALDVKDFPIGIAKITLFDRRHKPQSERLVFVNPHQKLNIKIEMPRKSYQPREKVKAEILTTNEKGQPVSANLSIAIVDDKMHTLADDKQDNLLSYMLMSEELRGKVHEPNFYFKEDESKARAALDYVMLTHGWRRYEWKEVLKGSGSYAFTKEYFEDISGQVYSKRGRPTKARITLFELGGKKRALQITTDKEGRFVFQNVDPFVDVQLIAENLSFGSKGCLIEIDQKKSRYRQPDPQLLNSLAGRAAGVQIISDNAILGRRQKRVKVRRKRVVRRALNQEPGNYSFSLNEEGSLNEVVVAAMGVERNSLAAKASVIEVKSAQSYPYFYLRATAAADPSFQPLYLVDGIPVKNQGFSRYFSPEDIYSVQVLNANEAVSLYGTRAKNGVVLIETHDRVTKQDFFRRTKPKKRRVFGQTFVAAYNFAPAKIFRAKEYKPNEQKPKKRTDFHNTIYWNPEVITNKKGKAKITFWNNDALTTFRMIAEGVGKNGQLGRTESTYFAKLPFELTAKIPPYFTVGDSLQLPVYLANNTNQQVRGVLKISASQAFAFQEQKIKVVVTPQTNQTVYLFGSVIRPLLMNESNKLQVRFLSKRYKESYQKEVEIMGKGFPVERSFSGNEAINKFEYKPDHIVQGTLQAELVAYPNIYKDLLEGIKAIIRRPYGCFEQVSSSTYPNILALQFLQKTGKTDREFSKRALGYIREGYRKLAAYETRENGFEWYGKTPPHEGLTAFGLLEFMEMKKVYNGVNQQMLERTKRWLLSRKNNKGGFKQNRGKYGFAAASKEVNNAYIVYALTQAGIKNLSLEYRTVFREAYKSQDAYRMALATLSSLNMGEPEKARLLLNQLRSQIKQKGLGGLTVDHTLVRSYGISAQLETVALIAMAEMRFSKPDRARIQRLINYLIKRRRGGYFGSTQGTILALQALTQYAYFQGGQAKSGKLLVYQGSTKIGEVSYSRNQMSDIRLSNLAQYLRKDGGDITVRFKHKNQVIPFNLNIRYQTYKPNSSVLCNIDLKTKLSASQVKVNETVRLTTTIRNKKSQGVPSTIALVGIPSGLSPQPWQLKELLEKKQVAYYEIYGSYIVFYFREMAPNMVKTIHLDLKADVPGLYRAPASSAYLYYTSEHKDWEAGTEILVKPALAN